MPGYWKKSEILSTFWTGTMRREESDTKILFLFMIDQKDRRGEVFGAWDHFAFHCGFYDGEALSKKRFEQALKRLMAPDPESTSKLMEGRRVVQLGPNHYKLVTHEEQERKLAAERKRARDREGRRERYAREVAAKNDRPGPGVAEPPALSPSPPMAETGEPEKKPPAATPPELIEAVRISHNDPERNPSKADVAAWNQLTSRGQNNERKAYLPWVILAVVKLARADTEPRGDGNFCWSQQLNSFAQLITKKPALVEGEDGKMKRTTVGQPRKFDKMYAYFYEQLKRLNEQRAAARRQHD